MTLAPARGLTWDWSLFGLGALYALPAVVVTPFNTLAGLGLALGVLPAAAFNLPAIRRGRRVIPLVGAISAVGVVVGSLLTQVPWLAVVAILLFAIGASLFARTSRLGALVLLLGLPLTGIGLSFGSVASALVVGGLMLAGSVYAWVVSLLWPEHQVDPPPRPETPSIAAALVYGVLLGLAGAGAAAVAYLSGLEHVGWAAAAALLVMRPVRGQLVLRSVGRAISVLLGAFAAAGFGLLGPAGLVTGLAVGLALASVAATTRSRWYVAPAFTSFIALTTLLHVGDTSPAAVFLERILDTLIGVGFALLFGAAIPAIVNAIRDRGTRA